LYLPLRKYLLTAVDLNVFIDAIWASSRRAR
jgi:hypothetical protein